MPTVGFPQEVLRGAAKLYAFSLTAYPFWGPRPFGLADLALVPEDNGY
jgi:hypothetical protein